MVSARLTLPSPVTSGVTFRSVVVPALTGPLEAVALAPTAGALEYAMVDSPHELLATERTE